jgi:hypothetical protein
MLGSVSEREMIATTVIPPTHPEEGRMPGFKVEIPLLT